VAHAENPVIVKSIAYDKAEGTKLHGGASSGYFGSMGITVKITVANDRAASSLRLRASVDDGSSASSTWYGR